MLPRSPGAGLEDRKLDIRTRPGDPPPPGSSAALAVGRSGPATYSAGMATEPFRHTHRVTYADCTVGDHIYYARYLDLLEAARGELFRHLGLPCRQLEAHDAIFPVIECRLRYQAPARYDDALTIEVWPVAVERIRLTFAHRVWNQSHVLILEGETFHVCTNRDGKPKRLPTDLIERLRPFLPDGRATQG